MKPTRLFVSRLSSDIQPQELRSLFTPYGRLTDVFIPVDRATGRKKGMAFVELADEASAQRAVKELDRSTFKGRGISVSIAKERTQNGNTTDVSRAKRSFNPKKNLAKQSFDISLFVNKSPIEFTEEIYTPTNTFLDFPFNQRIKENIKRLGYLHPTPIQDQAIPYILDGRDIIGIANTGTGKTAAFLLPLLQKVLTNRNERVLIITPTRELAAQIKDDLQSYSRELPINSCLCIGGVNIHSQIMKLRTRPQFVIGTPGRLKDLVETKKIQLPEFSNIVLDEVDRMLDMGFIEDITFLTSRLPTKRQSLFFSATLPNSLKPLMESFLRTPVTVSVKKQETASSIEQDVIHVQKQKKVEALHDLLVQENFSKVLIFGKTKHGVEKLATELAKRGFKVAAIHGNKTQSRRQKALQMFKQNSVQILVATDVAARGLDIPQVSHVINYDMPQTYEDYIHRIGRTGRAQHKGYALTFIEH